MLRGPCMAPYAKADAKRAPRASLVRWGEKRSCFAGNAYYSPRLNRHSLTFFQLTKKYDHDLLKSSIFLTE